MGKIIEIPFTCNLIEFIAERLLKEEQSDFSPTAIVFPHQRPGFYLRQAMAERLKRPFFPPRIFSMDEFMAFLTEKTSPGLALTNSLDSAYLLYQIVANIPDNPWQKADSSFNRFLFWGLKLSQVIEELDIELIEDKQLKSIEMGDLWGPNVARHAGILMNHLAEIRQVYHSLLEERRLTTRGRNYAIAAENIDEGDLSPLKVVYFVGLFAMTRAEKKVIRHLLSQPDVNLIRQNDGTRWTPFEEMDGWNCGWRTHFVGTRDCRINDLPHPNEKHPKLETRNSKLETEIYLHRAFNTHSEVVGLKDILTNSANPQSAIRKPQAASCKPQAPEKTAIVLPEPEPLIPLLSEVMTTLPVDYNITMGYPAVRTPIYALLDLFIKLQESKRENTYYLQDYLALLMHPYLKNIRHKIESTQTRILIHSIEERLLEEGKAFISLNEIEQKEEIFEKAERLTQRKALIQDFKDILTEIHRIFIRKMAEIKTLAQLASSFEEILIFLLRHSPAAHYPFSGEFFNSFFGLLDKIKSSLIKDEEFKEPKDLFDLFRHVAKAEHIPFQGIPLKGLQVLGLLETRSLNFDRVFLLSANEGLLPAVESFDSLLPLPLRDALGMPLHYQHEEIYRYHFHHLISSAREVHIFYRQIEKESRSRFVERLVWEEEKKKGQLEVLKAGSVELNVSLRPSDRFEVTKDPKTLNVLQKIEFSASGLNSYLKCPAQFYFANVLRLKEKERMPDELEAGGVGNILHEVMEKLYQPFTEKGVLGEQEYACLEKNLADILEKVFLEKFGELRGEQYLLKEMALDRLKRYILLEKKRFVDNIRIISTEKELSCSLKLKDGVVVRLKGRPDRIDQVREEYIIIDYKSGRDLTGYSFNVPEKVFTCRDEMKEEIKSLQLPFYVLLYQRVHSIPPGRINSRLISLQTTEEKSLFKEEINREEFLEDLFLPTIKNLIGEILDPAVPFVGDDKRRGCQYCPFPTLCRQTG